MDFFIFLRAVGPADHPYETGDPDVDALIDLLEHEPKLGGILGARAEEHAAHIAEVDRLIAKLELSPDA